VDTEKERWKKGGESLWIEDPGDPPNWELPKSVHLNPEKVSAELKKVSQGDSTTILTNAENRQENQYDGIFKKGHRRATRFSGLVPYCNI